MADPTGFHLPTTDEFDTFVTLDPSVETTDWTTPQKIWAVRAASDLMILATGMGNGTDAPDPDSPLGRVVNNGILDMAFSLVSSFDDRAAQQYSPFASEHLGSYSYSRFITTITSKQATGVQLFDQAVALFNAQNSDNSTNGQFAHNSEMVFSNNFADYENSIRADSHRYGGWR